jgi:GNAT superfamily N-acetyltransferase
VNSVAIAGADAMSMIFDGQSGALIAAVLRPGKRPFGEENAMIMRRVLKLIRLLTTLAETGEIVVAEVDGHIVGAVAYIGPGQPKVEFFQPEWPIMRMLVVAPEARGHGIGRALAEECLRRANRDGAAVFALHTGELMQIARPMYRRMGFTWHSAAPDIHGVKYAVYTKDLTVPLNVAAGDLCSR